LDAGELDKDLLRTCHFLHFGAVSLTDEPSRTATLEAARIAKEAGAIISYDRITGLLCGVMNTKHVNTC